MDYFIVAFALLFILFMTFEMGMRDLFPTRHKAFIDSQQRRWAEMEMIPFPRLQKGLTYFFRLALIYALILACVVCMHVFFRQSFGQASERNLALYGLVFVFLPLMVARLYVYFAANGKSMDKIGENQHWGFLGLFFLLMYYFI